MGETTEQVDQAGGMDRRLALKRVAVGGAIAWTVPALLSSRVSAQEACTPKCGPVAGVIITATVEISACDGINEPGGQPVRGKITSITGEADGCGCGGDPDVTVNFPTIGDEFQIRPQPGNEAADFVAAVTVTCLDRQDRPVSNICSVTFTDAGDPGNCQSRGGDIVEYSASAVCDPAFCGAPA